MTAYNRSNTGTVQYNRRMSFIWIVRILLCNAIVLFILHLVYSSWRQQIVSVNPKLECTLEYRTYLVGSHLTDSNSNLPNLSALDWPVPEYDKWLTRPCYKIGRHACFQPKPFEPRISKGQRTLFQHLLTVFSDMMFKHGLGDRFFIMGGTLVGSFRHHDMIPYDDDVDLLLDIAVRPIVLQLLNRLAPDYLFSDYTSRIKVYTKFIPPERENEDLQFSRNIVGSALGWPNLDIGLYRQNETHVWEIEEYFGKFQIWPRELVYPLLFRPLGTSWFPAPNNVYAFLQICIPQTENCLTSRVDHIFEKQKSQARMPCRDLGHRYAFVKHSVSSSHVCSDSTSFPNLKKLVFAEEQLLIRLPNTSLFRHIHTINLVVHQDSATVDIYDYSRHE